MTALRIDVITIFPEWFSGPLDVSLLGRAQREGQVDIRLHNPRAWATDVHRTVDDTPYGGGAGMVMRGDVLIAAAEGVWNDLPASDDQGAGSDSAQTMRYVAGGERPTTILLTPRGRPFTQQRARELASLDRIVLVCGRYEGIDERVHELVATEECSIGDYVLFGGEVAAAAIIESVVRLVGGVVGNESSPVDESFADGLLEYPQYTRPADLRGRRVPDVLLSGDHAAIAAWRRTQAEALTRGRRPDLFSGDGGLLGPKDQ